MRGTTRWGFAALVVMSGGSLAGQGGPTTAAWLDLGVGVGSIGRTGGVALHSAYRYQRGANLFTARSAIVVDVIGGLLRGFGNSRENIGAVDLGLLYGRARRPAHGFYALSIGAGLQQITRDSAGARHRTYRLTLPLEAQVAWRPGRFIGFQALGFASLNRVQSFRGITIGAQLGRLY